MRTMGGMVLAAVVLAGCASEPTLAPVPEEAAKLTSLEIQSEQHALPSGGGVAMFAVAKYSDGSIVDATRSVVWSSTNPSVVRVTRYGVATGVKPGETRVFAELGGKIATANIIVTNARLEAFVVLPRSASVPIGLSGALRAIGTFSDGSTADITASVKWSLSGQSFELSADEPGVFKAIAGGDAKVVAAWGSMTDRADLSVGPAVMTRLEIVSSAQALVAGNSADLRAVAHYSDGTFKVVTQQVAWTTDQAKIATISESGVLSAWLEGRATVLASLGGLAATATLDVTGIAPYGIYVDPGYAAVPAGRAVQLHAVALYTDGSMLDVTSQARWTSDAPDQLSVAAGGLALGLRKGGANVVAQFGNVSTAVNVGVLPAELVGMRLTAPEVRVGMRQAVPFRSFATYSDGTEIDVTQLSTWTSLDPLVATLSNVPESKGLALGLDDGTARLFVEYGGMAVYGSLVVTIEKITALEVAAPTTQLSPGQHQLTVWALFEDGTREDLTAFATWSTSAPLLATVRTDPGHEGLLVVKDQTQLVVNATVWDLSGQGVFDVTLQ